MYSCKTFSTVRENHYSLYCVLLNLLLKLLLSLLAVDFDWLNTLICHYVRYGSADLWDFTTALLRLQNAIAMMSLREAGAERESKEQEGGGSWKHVRMSSASMHAIACMYICTPV